MTNARKINVLEVGNTAVVAATAGVCTVILTWHVAQKSSGLTVTVIAIHERV